MERESDDVQSRRFERLREDRMHQVLSFGHGAVHQWNHFPLLSGNMSYIVRSYVLSDKVVQDAKVIKPPPPPDPRAMFANFFKNEDTSNLTI